MVDDGVPTLGELPKAVINSTCSDSDPDSDLDSVHSVDSLDNWVPGAHRKSQSSLDESRTYSFR